MGDQGLLRIRNLTVTFTTEAGRVPVVEDLSLSVPRGSTVALVGESGCGKSVTALSVLRLLPQPPARIESGEILLAPEPDLASPPAGRASNTSRNHGTTSLAQHGGAALGRGTHDRVRGTPSGDADLLRIDEKSLRSVRGGRIAMVFQDPLTSLNPVMTAGQQIVEAIRLHQPVSRSDARDQAIELLRDVGIAEPSKRVDAYPHELSGGMRQRVMIAMALACEPDLLIADEPTTALDVTVQAQILELLRSLQQRRGLSILLITHDLGVVAQVADEVYVMYAGRIVEHAATEELFAHPLHPYTLGLLACTPRVTGPDGGRLSVIEGTVPRPESKPPGCPFHPRCSLAQELARRVRPDKSDAPEHGDAALGRGTHASGRSTHPGQVEHRTITLEGPPSIQTLRRCVESYDGEPSGRPALREIRPAHHVACWEAGA